MPDTADIAAPLRLLIDGQALAANWRWLRDRGGTADCGAAIKANGYGLGAAGVMHCLAEAGCRDFFVATWAEAQALLPLADGIALSVLHGVREEDVAFAAGSGVRPVLSSAEQVARWQQAGGGACDVMVDTGMNRLGFDWQDDLSPRIEGLDVRTLLSHLACADEDHPLNRLQRDRFADLAARHPELRASLANSAGICLGRDYGFGLTRPGIALYGGIPRAEAEGHIRQVVQPQVQIIQRRHIRAGEGIGYNATVTAPHDLEAAILNIGYADGYLRGFSGRGAAVVAGRRLPVLGRVSMDLLIVDVSARPDLCEGDWLDLAYALPEASALSGLSQYELLTGLGARYERRWV
ncbi:alanine racemase [Sphingobium aquiterrae]|uniref:alanine racemase n=1 Tax=Sphingobium aquiterrae TaxID=2038656 RepID=UPI003016876C